LLNFAEVSLIFVGNRKLPEGEGTKWDSIDGIFFIILEK
jgi:hypothetical protein